MFPGTRTFLRIAGLWIVVSVGIDAYKWANSHLSGLGLELALGAIIACGFYYFCRFFFPMFGVSVHESMSLYWAGFLFTYLPLFTARAVIILLAIQSPFMIGLVYFLAFIQGVLIHMAWNIRAFRTHTVVVSNQSSSSPTNLYNE